MKWAPKRILPGCLVPLLVAAILTAPRSAPAAAPCHGSFPNPITDICWRCIFPLRIGPLRIGFGQEDAGDSPPLLCTCPAPPPLFLRVGIGVSFWEPARVSEVVRTPFCAPLLGGFRLPGPDRPQGGGASHSDDAFYHVHWYSYPVLFWVGLLTQGVCLQQETLDLLYMSELDPLWQDDELNFLINPEAALFGNPAAQTACAADCVAATTAFPVDRLFWCAGCQGSMYPLTGSVDHHSGGVDSSLLLTQRAAFKMHRQLVARDTSTRAAMCGPQLQATLRKGQYKTQMLWPRPLPSRADPFGRLSLPWAAGREYPVRGEDWGYLLFRRRMCCAL